MAKVVGQLKAGYVERFKDDSTLPKSLVDKKNEIEALFVQMDTITQSLSALDVALQEAAVLHREQTAARAVSATAAAATATAAAAAAAAEAGAKAAVLSSCGPAPPEQAPAAAPGARATVARIRAKTPQLALALPSSEGTGAAMSVDASGRTTGHKAVRDLTNEELLEQRALRRKTGSEALALADDV